MACTSEIRSDDSARPRFSPAHPCGVWQPLAGGHPAHDESRHFRDQGRPRHRARGRERGARRGSSAGSVITTASPMRIYGGELYRVELYIACAPSLVHAYTPTPP